MDIDAILLAAGQGRRFGGMLPSGCKVLIEVEGQCLLDRHLDALFGGGVAEVTIVVGHDAHRIEARTAERGAGRPITLVHNPRHREGSLYSLYCARDHLEAGRTTLVMDADVLYDARLVEDLVRAPCASGLLFDGGFLDDEMKVGLAGGRAVALGKDLRADAFDALGRGPGFYKLDPHAGRALARILEAMVAEGLSGSEYEDALTRLFAEADVEAVSVEDRAWTEIDHAQDLERARREIWPRIAAVEAQRSGMAHR